MTIAQNSVAKLSVAFVTVAMLFSLVAPAQAQTVEELQAQIAALMAQISSLSGSPAATTGSCVTPVAPLTMGSQGAEVTALQNLLISMGQSIPAGATGYFGGQTQAALASWQAANGVTPAAGYYGPVTKAAMDAKCVPATNDDEDEDDSETGSDELSGEASLDNLEIESASDDEIEEGSEDAEIAVVTVEFADGDAEISRMDVTLDGVTDVWDVLETVSLWVDGDMVAEMDANDEDEYLDTTGTAGTLRFSGLDIVAMEDEEVEITVAATVAGSVDTADLGAYSVAVDTLRFFDADGVASTEDAGLDFGVEADFTIEEAGAEDELIAKTSTEDPDGTTIQVEDDSKSDFETVFIFDLDTDDSVNDIELNTIQVVVTTNGTVATSSGFNDLVDDAELVIDGVTIDDYTVASGDATTEGAVTLEFDVDGDVTIDAGDRVAAELMLRFKALPSGEEGATVVGSIASLDTTVVDAEGADDLGNTQLSGSATGDVHTLRTAGVNVSLSEVDADVTTQDLATNDYATYVVEVEVTAFEQDAYISTDPAVSFNYVLENGASAAAVAGTRTVTVTSTGDEQGAYFLVNEGETETFTLTVTYVPGVANTAARMQLESIEFAATAIAPDQIWTASPEEDYRTAVVTVVN